jgi:DNA-directed RNA polymerase specialized sigma subunit
MNATRARRYEVDAMLEAAAIDPRLPKIIYLRKRGKTLRQIGAECGMAESMVRKIIEKCAPKLLYACGLRKI